MGQEENEMIEEYLLNTSENQRAFRLNCGGAAVPIRPKETKYDIDENGNRVIKISNYSIIKLPPAGWWDVIGFESVTITPDMVGKSLAVFKMIEFKTKGGTLSKSQKKTKDMVLNYGGICELITKNSESEENTIDIQYGIGYNIFNKEEEDGRMKLNKIVNYKGYIVAGTDSSIINEMKWSNLTTVYISRPLKSSSKNNYRLSEGGFPKNHKKFPFSDKSKGIKIWVHGNGFRLKIPKEVILDSIPNLNSDNIIDLINNGRLHVRFKMRNGCVYMNIVCIDDWHLT